MEQPNSTSTHSDSKRREGWSLRAQFVTPLAGTILIVSAFITLISWSIASNSSKGATVKRLEDVYSMCNLAQYPLTPRVVKDIKLFSGIDIALLDEDRSLQAASLEISDRSKFHNAAIGLDMHHKTDKDRRVVHSVVGSTELHQISIGNETYDYLGGRFYQANTPGVNSIVLLLNQRERTDATWRALWAPAISGIASVLAMAVVAAVVASKIVQRIEKTERQVNRIALGNYDVIEINGPDDAIMGLSQSVNKMSQQLSVAHEKISKSERSRLINLIASGMAHQLRNSLAGAILLLQTFLRTKPPGDAQELSMALNQLNLAKESIRSLLAVNTDLEFSDYADLSIDEIHARLKSYVQGYADHHRVSFTADYPQEFGFKRITRGSAIVGALMNLTMNAIEATSSHGQVECKLEVHDTQNSGSLEFLWRIVDDGPGPATNIVDSMLEPFVTSKSEGVGLGLPMAKRIAEQFHGRLRWCRENNKTVFEFLIAEPK